MPLKSVELIGYKTFATKATFEFSDTITAVVGPNGSGKSNIADAIRWVLGEQSYRLLRGRRTSDMIFSGSERRPQAGMASATVLFDNTEGWLPIDYTEVAITRRAYRDGQNEYLLNGQKVRLRDVSELLARSGLAERTYTIIGQGLVDRALSLKPEERRKLFEEAAGIGLYRSRREEAFKRLDTTRRNLERVQDIVAELRPRLRSLERQARRAEDHERLKKDLHLLLREWYGYHWHRGQQVLRETRGETKAQEKTLNAARSANQKLLDEIGKKQGVLQDVKENLNKWQREHREIDRRRETVSRSLAVAEERKRALDEQQSSIALEIRRVANETAVQIARLERIEEDIKRLTTDFETAGKQTEQAREVLDKRRRDRQQQEDKLQDARDRMITLSTRRARLSARIGELEAGVTQRQMRLEAEKQRFVEAQQVHDEAETRHTKLASEVETNRQERVQAEKAVQEIQKNIAHVESTIQKFKQSSREQLGEIGRYQTQLEIMQQAERALAGYSEGPRRLLTAARKGQLSSFKDTLNNLVGIPAEYEKAVAALLGEYIDAVVLEDGVGLVEALSILEKMGSRGVLLPLSEINSPSISAPPTDSGIIGNAAQLVESPPEVESLVNLLLGDAWIVTERGTATRLVGSGSFSGRAATLKGEVFYSGGQVAIGAPGSDSGGGSVLSRPRVVKKLTEELTKAQAIQEDNASKIIEAESQLTKLKHQEVILLADLQATRSTEDETNAEIVAARSAVTQAAQQWDWHDRQSKALADEISRAQEEIKQAEGEDDALKELSAGLQKEIELFAQKQVNLPLEQLQTDFYQWDTKAAVAERALAEAKIRQADQERLITQGQRREQEQNRALENIEDFKQTLLDENARAIEEEAELTELVKFLQEKIEPAEIRVAELEQTLTGLQKQEMTARQGLGIAERHHTQAQIALARRQENLDALRQRIEDDFGLVSFEYEETIEGPKPLPFGSDLVEDLPVVKTISPSLDGTIKEMRGQLRRIGAVNPEAKKEFDEVSTRYEFLSTQIEDLNKAEVDIKEIISELDLLMEREFRKTFDAVAAEFRQTFTRLFGGGSGRLFLSDPENLTDSGVDIEARLPGRRMQGLSLLSGGERSLTAAALVFSLIKVSPTPFCILDEVDAMLDEANIGRFTELLRELSVNTQFIIITHNRNTVQTAETIYGITMGSDSVSQVLSLKLDEVASTLKQ